MKIDGTPSPGNTLALLPPAGEGIRLAIGDLVRADVLSLQADGTVSIRVTTEGGKSGVVSARSDVPLGAGESILLKVVGAGSEVSLRFLGVVGEGNAAAGLPEACRGLAAQLAAARLPSEGAREALESLRILAQAVKEGVPAFPALAEAAADGQEHRGHQERQQERDDQRHRRRRERGGDPRRHRARAAGVRRGVYHEAMILWYFRRKKSRQSTSMR